MKKDSGKSQAKKNEAKSKKRVDKQNKKDEESSKFA